MILFIYFILLNFGLTDMGSRLRVFYVLLGNEETGNGDGTPGGRGGVIHLFV